MAVILFADDGSTKCNSSLIPFSMLSLAVKNRLFLYMLWCESIWRQQGVFQTPFLLVIRDINYYMIVHSLPLDVHQMENIHQQAYGDGIYINLEFELSKNTDKITQWCWTRKQGYKYRYKYNTTRKAIFEKLYHDTAVWHRYETGTIPQLKCLYFLDVEWPFFSLNFSWNKMSLLLRFLDV